MPHVLAELILHLRRLRAGRSGNVVITFALLLMPMLGAIGLAVDYGSVLTARTIAQVGADAAALQAAGIARDLIQQGSGSAAESDAAIVEAKRRGSELFATYTGQHGLKDYNLVLDVTRQNQTISSTASFAVFTDTFLARLYGQERYEANGVAASNSSLPSYVDVTLAVDTSQSMGIAATSSEMDRLYKLRGCVFGCHVVESGQSTSNEQAAKTAGIRLRIDVIRDAIVKMIGTAQKDAGGSASYRFAMYLMGANPSSPTAPLTTELSPISGVYATLMAKAQTIALGWNNTSGVGDSHINDQITGLAAKLVKSGDGSSQGNARSYFFLMTDGLRDVYGKSCTSGHCTATIDPAACQLLKDKNITVGVLYTTFLPIYNSPMNPSSGFQINYKQLVVDKGLVPLIGPRLQQCASSGWFFEAADADGIDRAITQMFAQTTNAPALTQ